MELGRPSLALDRGGWIADTAHARTGHIVGDHEHPTTYRTARQNDDRRTPDISAERHVRRARGLDRLLGPDQYVERSEPT
jgi:hypothetical protein